MFLGKKFNELIRYIMLKALIISTNTWLEALLKQHFSNIDINTGSEASENIDILINDGVNLNIKALEKTWLLSKPISINKLVDIIEQALQLLSDNIIQIGSIIFHPKEKLCKFKQEEITLTQKETEILLYLSQQKQEVDKLTLLHAVWSYSNEISTHTLETHIYKLRNKFSIDIIGYNENGYFLSGNL